MADIDIEAVRDYWNRRPCNIRHSPSEVGTREYFDQVEARKYFVEPHIPGFADFAKWSGKRVLDIGCGIGTDAINFARAGAEYTGLELSDVSLDLARRRFDVFGHKGELLLGDAAELSRLLGGRSFDLVYSFGVIHHAPVPRRIIDAIASVVTPTSELRLMLYARDSWKSLMIDEGFDQPEAQSGCPVAFTYTHDEVRALLADYEVTSIEQDHIFPYVVEKYVRYEYEKVSWFKEMPAAMFRALERRWGWHTLIRARPR